MGNSLSGSGAQVLPSLKCTKSPQSLQRPSCRPRIGIKTPKRGHNQRTSLPLALTAPQIKDTKSLMCTLKFWFLDYLVSQTLGHKVKGPNSKSLPCHVAPSPSTPRGTFPQNFSQIGPQMAEIRPLFCQPQSDSSHKRAFAGSANFRQTAEFLTNLEMAWSGLSNALLHLPLSLKMSEQTFLQVLKKMKNNF